MTAQSGTRSSPVLQLTTAKQHRLEVTSAAAPTNTHSRRGAASTPAQRFPYKRSDQRSRRWEQVMRWYRMRCAAEAPHRIDRASLNWKSDGKPLCSGVKLELRAIVLEWTPESSKVIRLGGASKRGRKGVERGIHQLESTELEQLEVVIICARVLHNRFVL